MNVEAEIEHIGDSKMHEIRPMNARTETDHNGVLKQCMVYNQRIQKQNLNRMETEKNACFKTTECKNQKGA